MCVHQILHLRFLHSSEYNPSLHSISQETKMAKSSFLVLCFIICVFFYLPTFAKNLKDLHFEVAPLQHSHSEMLYDKNKYSNVIPSESSVFRVCDPGRLAQHSLEMSNFDFCNISLSYEVRARDIVDRMTLAEKVKQIGDASAGVNRLGIPPYQWWSEALHGVSNVGPGTYFDSLVPGATSFPTVILSAASFNESLWKIIGQAVSTEARAMYNVGRAGLTFWSPNINVVRDPRWGRTLETPGEDPFTVGRYAVNYVRGLQDIPGTENWKDDPNTRPLKVSSCCKHYAAYDLDNWLGVNRLTFDARVREQDMVETFIRPFEMCVKDGDASSVMCSFNRVNGFPTCADPHLLNYTVRGTWDLHGYIVSDCDSVEAIVDNQKWLGDSDEDAVAQTLKAGLDLDCGDFFPHYAEAAVRDGKVSEAEIDKALRHLYVVLMRLGFFDGNPQLESLGTKDICTHENIELATEAARQGIVLLKNDANALPLNASAFRSLVVVGPHSQATSAMIGNYAGVPCKFTSPLDGLSRYALVNNRPGCSDIKCKDRGMIAEAMRVAQSSDATIIFAGLDLGIENEGLDRVDFDLPGYQADLIDEVASVSKGPAILVIFSAGGVDLSFAKDNKNIKAIIWAGYPGEEGGQAIADVIFGKYNPGGKLPVTWYHSEYVSELPMDSMPLRPLPDLGYPGRTYKFFNGPVVFPFGHGLSYTEFRVSVAKLEEIHIKLGRLQHCRDIDYLDGVPKPACAAVATDQLDCAQTFELEVAVENVGDRDGNEVVMVYSKPPRGLKDTPIKQLIGFQRVFVPVGATRVVTFDLNLCEAVRVVDGSAYAVLPAGAHTIAIGDDVASVSLPLSFSF